MHPKNNILQNTSELIHLFERISDAFFALDNDWNYTYLNKSALALHNADAASLLGKNIWVTYPELVNGQFYKALHTAKETQQSQRNEFYDEKNNKWYDDLIYPDEEGISVYYNDITERKKTIEQLKISEEALRLSTELYSYVAKATNDAIWDWDIKNDILKGNEIFYSLFDAPINSTFNYNSFIEKVHPDDRIRLRDNYDSAILKRQTLLTEEFRFRISDGKYRVLNDRAYILYDSNQKPYRMLGAMQDITTIKETERKLLIEKELSDSVINSLPGIFYLFNKEGEFIRWNKNFETVTGYTAAEIKKKQPLDFFAADEIEMMHKKIENVFKEGVDFAEAFFVTKDNCKIPFYFTGMRIHYEQEDCVLGVGIDISQKKEAEEVLKISEEKYKLLFNENPLPMWILDTEANKFLNANNAAINIYGYSKAEFLQMPITALHPENDLAFEEWNANKNNGLEVGEMNWEHKKKDGTLIKVNILSNEIMYEGKVAYLAMANDITDKFKAEESLQESHKAFRELASHLETIREGERTRIAREIHDELGQQLTGLKMDISWINRKVKSEDLSVQEKMKDIIQLIDNTVITVRRIATQLRPDILDDLGLISAMDWQSDDFQKRFGIKSSFSSNVNHVSVTTDIATNIFRIFQESLTNISRHSKATEVTTTLNIKEDLLTLNIKDNGIGFNETEIKNKKTLGILGMKERAVLIKGHYEIISDTDNGTSVIISVPLSHSSII